MSRTRHSLLVLMLAIALLIPTAERVDAGDDTDLFSSRVSPNVVFIFDNSASMNHVVWHPAYNPAVVYDPIGCPYIADPNDPAYNPLCLEHALCPIAKYDTILSGSGDGYVGYDDRFHTRNGGTATLCSNTREVFNDEYVDADGNNTLWALKYLQWYFSDNVDEDPDGDGDTIYEDIIAENNADRSQCLINQGKSATYDRYRRARITAAKDITLEVICNTSEVADIRYGLATFYTKRFWFYLLDPEGGWVTVPIEDYSPSHADDLEDAIEAFEGETFTPLGETLYNVYRYLQERDDTKTAVGKNGTTRFPKYNIRENGTVSTTSIPPHPVLNECQKHFVVIITDGEPTKDDFRDPSSGPDALPPSKTIWRDQLIGDYKSPGDEDEEPPSTFDTALYLDDVASFMQENDFLPDAAFPGTQVVDTYTVGFTTNSTANDLLSRTAIAGNGEFFFSNNAEELTEALTGAITSIVAKSLSFTSAAVPASRTTDGNNFFASYFKPSDNDAYWEGHLKLFEFNQAGEVRDKPTAAQAAANQEGDCALDDDVVTECNSGRLKIELGGYWDAANEIPAPNSRNLYVSRYQDANGGLPGTIPSTPVDFSESDLTETDLGVSVGDITAYAGVGNGISGITSGEELADTIVRYIRGCEFDSGACVDRGDGRKLWDIFHSNPVVVGPPNQGLREESYQEFVSRYKFRKRVIFAGSNGGFVHGFNAGEYGTAAVPSGYDRETAEAGKEEFAFMAYPARQNIATLPIDVPPRGEGSWNGYTMDGSPSAADVWLYPSATTTPDEVTGAAWNKWRTALIGGMRQGGNVIWALDVTNPADFDSPLGEQTSGPAYPQYMWEFPCEDTTDTVCSGNGNVPSGFMYSDFMGETWSQPVITRVKVKVNCTTSCTYYDRWVAIFGGGYAPEGDPNDVSYDATSTASTNRQGRAVFMVDITSGELLAMRRFDDVATDGNTDMKYAFAAQPGVFDLNHDGYADVAYFGDLGGNLWKWVISDAVPDAVNNSTSVAIEHRYNSTNDTGWKFFKIFTAENCDTADGCDGGNPGPPPHYKSIFFPPSGALVGAKLYLALGTGERANLDFLGSISEEKNRFYVFHDRDPLEREVTLPSVGTARYTDKDGNADFVDVTSLTGACTPPPSPTVGFYFDGDVGEKFVTDSSIFFGVVLTGSYIPGTSSNPCDAGGSSFLYGFDLFCGEGSLTDPTDPFGSRLTRISLGDGLPNHPRVSVGPVTDGGSGGSGSCNDVVMVITSESGGYQDCPGGRPDSGLSVETWRDD